MKNLWISLEPFHCGEGY